MEIVRCCFSVCQMENIESLQLSITTSLYPAIPANHERIEVPDFILPGEGEIKYWDNMNAKCGDTKYTIKCKDEYHCNHPVELIPFDCGRYECPVCYPRALKRGAVGVREHVWNTLVEMKKAFSGTRWIISSVIISAPPEIYDMTYDKQHYYFRKSLKKLGTQNVAAIYHRWRYRNNATGEVFDEVPWREYKAHPELYERVLGIHWHCFVIGRMVTSDVYFASTGWVYKKMKTDRGTYALGKKDIYQIAYYALSHAALSTTSRSHAVHYYGMFWRLSEIEKHIDFEPVVCPKCNNQRVQRTEYHDYYNDTFGLEVPAVKMIVHRKWILRGINYNDLDDGLDFTGYDAPVKEVEFVDLSDV